MSKNVSNASVTIQAAKNWKITWVYVSKYKTKDYSSYECDYYFSKNDGVNKLTLRPGAMKKSGSYYLHVQLHNIKTDGYLSCYYNINTQ